MSSGKAKRRGERIKASPPQRKYWIGALAAVAVVVILALLLHGNSDAARYERYRRQAADSYQSGDYDQALSDLRKAVALNPSQECYMLMADCYEAQGNWELALETLRRMDLNDPAVKSRIDALEQKRLQQEQEKLRVVAGESYDPGISELNLDGRSLGDGVLQELLQLHALQKLSLAENQLENLEPLEELGGLTELNLSGNAIRTLRPLAKLTNLRSLNLDGNPLEDLSPLYGLRELGTLSLRGITLGEDALRALSEQLPRCAILTDGSKDDRTNIWLSGQCFDTEVTELKLNGLGLRDLSCLSLCTQLRRLELCDNEIMDLSPLMNLQKLEQLKIAGNQVSDLRPLMGLGTLYRLDAARNAVSDTSAVGSMSSLTELDLSDNPIQEFSGLKKLNNLQVLRLENTGLTDEDLVYLQGLTRLTRLALDGNDGLTADAVGPLKSALSNCSVSHDPLVYLVSLGGLTFRTDEKSLRMEGTELSELFGLEKFDRLESLSLGRNRIENISVLQDSRSRETLKTLDLSYNRIQDISALAAMTALEELDLRGNDISSLRPLMHLSSLKILRLTGNPLTEEQLQALRDALPNCTVEF